MESDYNCFYNSGMFVVWQYWQFSDRKCIYVDLERLFFLHYENWITESNTDTKKISKWDSEDGTKVVTTGQR